MDQALKLRGCRVHAGFKALTRCKFVIDPSAHADGSDLMAWVALCRQNKCEGSFNQPNAVRNRLREQADQPLNTRIEWLIHLLTQMVLTS